MRLGPVGFADFSGNRQYISMGNLSENDRAFMFLMDYPNRRRIKIWACERTGSSGHSGTKPAVMRRCRWHRT